jgi:hypothetical protein
MSRFTGGTSASRRQDSEIVKGVGGHEVGPGSHEVSEVFVAQSKHMKRARNTCTSCKFSPPEWCRAIRDAAGSLLRLLILFTESLDVRFAVGIKEFLAALLPRRLEFGRCDVPVRSAFLDNGT